MLPARKFEGKFFFNKVSFINIKLYLLEPLFVENLKFGVVIGVLGSSFVMLNLKNTANYQPIKSHFHLSLIEQTQYFYIA